MTMRTGIMTMKGRACSRRSFRKWWSNATYRWPAPDASSPRVTKAGSESVASPRHLQARSSAFRHRGYLLYWLSRFVGNFSTQIVSVAVGWQVYDLTRNPFDLGIVG